MYDGGVEVGGGRGERGGGGVHGAYAGGGVDSGEFVEFWGCEGLRLWLRGGVAGGGGAGVCGGGLTCPIRCVREVLGLGR